MKPNLRHVSRFPDWWKDGYKREPCVHGIYLGDECSICEREILNQKTLTEVNHKARHVELHRALDELAADWMHHTGKRMSSATVLELLQWSFTQTKKPTEIK